MAKTRECCGVTGRARSMCLSFTCVGVAVLAVGVAVSVIGYYHVRGEPGASARDLVGWFGPVVFFLFSPLWAPVCEMRGTDAHTPAHTSTPAASRRGHPQARGVQVSSTLSSPYRNSVCIVAAARRGFGDRGSRAMGSLAPPLPNLSPGAAVCPSLWPGCATPGLWEALTGTSCHSWCGL
jgi:hypothetical protein